MRNKPMQHATVCQCNQSQERFCLCVLAIRSREHHFWVRFDIAAENWVCAISLPNARQLSRLAMVLSLLSDFPINMG